MNPDNKTGSVHPSVNEWVSFFELMHAIKVPADFMTERPMNNLPLEKNLFDNVQ